MSASAPPQLRRSPQQARSRRRIEHVLETADRLLATEGPGALTTTRLAEAAGISVGSLYQWFPHKQAIAEALALRYVEDFKAVARELAAGTHDDPAGAAVDAFAEAFRSRPGFRAMWFGGLRTEELRDITRPALDDIAASLVRVLDRGSAVARMTVLVADALLRAAFREDPEGDAALLTETKVLLRSYVT
jgi:AcrR family transcriptional regulator